MAVLVLLYLKIFESYSSPVGSTTATIVNRSFYVKFLRHPTSQTSHFSHDEPSPACTSIHRNHLLQHPSSPCGHNRRVLCAATKTVGENNGIIFSISATMSLTHGEWHSAAPQSQRVQLQPSRKKKRKRCHTLDAYRIACQVYELAIPHTST